jgi:hypothetical protein
VPTEKNALTEQEIVLHLRVLEQDLGRFPSGSRCPWPLARVFNELLKRAKQAAQGDPIVGSIPQLTEATGEHESPSSETLVGTVAALGNQVVAALERVSNSSAA